MPSTPPRGAADAAAAAVGKLARQPLPDRAALGGEVERHDRLAGRAGTLVVALPGVHDVLAAQRDIVAQHIQEPAEAADVLPIASTMTVSGLTSYTRARSRTPAGTAASASARVAAPRGV